MSLLDRRTFVLVMGVPVIASGQAVQAMRAKLDLPRGTAEGVELRFSEPLNRLMPSWPELRSVRSQFTERQVTLEWRLEREPSQADVTRLRQQLADLLASQRLSADGLCVWVAPASPRDDFSVGRVAE
jgi:hypothetical protein